MKLKQFLAGAVSLALVATLAACGGTKEQTVKKIEKGDPLGKEAQLITVTRGTASDPNAKFPEGQTLDDNSYTRMLKEKFNIEVKNAFVASDYPAKVNAVIASGDLPDYLTNLTYTQYKAIVKAGLAMDISQYWDAYASDRSKDVYKSNEKLFDSLVKDGDAMYGIPSSQPEGDFLSVMWVRQDWLDKLGLKAPQNIDDLVAVATAFRDKDPDGNGKADTLGIIGPGKGDVIYNSVFKSNNNRHLDQIFAAYNSFPGIWVKDSNGKVVYGSTTPETKEALAKLAEMYKNGLFDKQLFTNESAKQVAANQGGIFFGTWWYPFVDIGGSVKNDKNANWQPYTFYNKDGKYFAKGGNAAQTFTVISKKAKNPQAIIKMLNIFKEGLANYVNEEDQKIMGDAAYPMYQTFSNAKALGLGLEQAQKFWAGETTKDDATAYLKNYDAYALQAFDTLLKTKKEPYTDFNIKTWDFGTDYADFGFAWSFGVGLKPYLSNDYTWVNSLSYEKTPTIEKRWSNLETLEYETFAKIITGAKSVDEFDAFVKQWKAEGGDTITKEISDTVK